jgi:hypothetical protein
MKSNSGLYEPSILYLKAVVVLAAMHQDLCARLSQVKFLNLRSEKEEVSYIEIKINIKLNKEFICIHLLTII